MKILKRQHQYMLRNSESHVNRSLFTNTVKECSNCSSVVYVKIQFSATVNSIAKHLPCRTFLAEPPSLTDLSGHGKLVFWAIPFFIHTPPDEVSSNLHPKKKKIKVPTQ